MWGGVRVRVRVWQLVTSTRMHAYARAPTYIYSHVRIRTGIRMPANPNPDPNPTYTPPPQKRIEKKKTSTFRDELELVVRLFVGNHLHCCLHVDVCLSLSVDVPRKPFCMDQRALLATTSLDACLSWWSCVWYWWPQATWIRSHVQTNSCP